MNSLRTKIVALTVAVVMFSSLAFLSVYFMTAARESRNMSAERLDLMTENLQQSLDAYLGDLEQSVEMAAHIASDSLDSLTLVEAGVIGSAAGEQKRTPEQEQALAAYLAAYCAEVQKSFYSIATHTNGIVTYYYCIAPEVSELEHGFFYSKVGKAGFEEQEPLDARQFDPNDMEHYTWYYTPIQRGRPSWIGPYLAHFLNEMWTLSYIAPIYKSGELIGLLGIDVAFDLVVSQVKGLEVYDSGFAFLLDEDGRVIYHPDLPMGTMPQMAAELVGSEGFQQRRSETPLRYEKLDGTWQLSFTTLSNGMKLVVTAPLVEINASYYRVTGVVLVVTLVLLAVFILLIQLLVNAMTKPLRVLTAASRRLSAGDYTVELDYDGQDEVGTLTSAFRQMRDHLQLYISDLNSRAYSDALTGVKSKGAFDISLGRLEDAIRHHNEGNRPAFAIVMFDCNGLKQINDLYGHQRGDAYLRGCCTLICHIFMHSPVFRIGGDEFVALLQREDYAQRDALMERFDAAMAEHNSSVSDPWDKVDLARGLAVYDLETDGSADEVLQRADKAMYANKAQSRAASGRP